MSWQMRVVAGVVRTTRRRSYLTEAGGEKMLRRPKGPANPPASLLGRLAVTANRLSGFDVYAVRRRVEGTSGPPGPAVVYLHGGAYVSQIVRQQWSLVGDLARASGAEVLVPLYGLAPDHDALEAHALLSEVLGGLAAAGRTAYLLGDSAGGGLALAAAQQAAVDHPGIVEGVTAIAPWLDLGITNPDVARLERVDPWLARPGLLPVARAWAGDLPLDDPRVSPLFGDLGVLPPVDVWVGTRDITLADCRLLRDRLPASVPLRYTEEPGALHVYPLLPVPEGRDARRRIVDRITTAVRGSPP